MYKITEVCTLGIQFFLFVFFFHQLNAAEKFTPDEEFTKFYQEKNEVDTLKNP